jgi:hypothetical protein
MRHIEIPIRVKYLSSNLSAAEKHPQVWFYLDADFKREPTVVQFEHGVGEEQSIVVKGAVKNTLKELPHNAAIGVASWAWRNNESGHPCMLDTGVSSILLSDIRRDGSFQRDIHLKMRTADGLEKGIVRVSIPISSDKLGLPVADPFIEDNASSSRFVSNYIDATMRQEQDMRDTLPGMDRMRMPYDYSEAGIGPDGVPLPAVSYTIVETPKADDGYWENAARTTMKRDGLDLDHDWHRLNLEGRARATILTIAYFAQYMDYIGDTVDKNCGNSYDQQLVQPYENFGDALATISGDCEDLAKAMKQCYNSFVTHKHKHPILLEMQKIANCYVPVLSLDGVMGAQVSQQQRSYGAHMNDNFIPIDEYEAWNGGKPSSKKTGLPFLVGEGTGMYEPLGYESPMLDQMRHVYAMPSLESFKKPILHTKSQVGAFFVCSLVGMTDYFYTRGAATPHSFVYVTKQPNGELTRGATYDDMINRPDRVGIVMHPTVPKRVMQKIHDQTKLRVPPRPLILTEKGLNRNPKHKGLEKVKLAVNGLGRKRTTPIEASLPIPVYLRPHQLRADIIDGMVADFTGSNRVYKVDYNVEPITDAVWGYRLQIYAN